MPIIHFRSGRGPIRISFRYGTYQANRYSESTRGFARDHNIRDKDAESYQGQNPKYGICSVGYVDVRISNNQLATRESDAE
ncbi:hypothetical protein TNCV_2714621 [Trichonephila clavipes]|nr:hypothetical protein TNCV_2714621 [Trichonephila clavipes]